MKKVIYIILWVILGIILSFIVHAIIELVYLKFADPQKLHWVTVFGGVCSLPIWLIYLLPILGIIFGLWAGFHAWDIIYKKRK